MAVGITTGDFYEDCRYHPMLCISVGADDEDELVGISLIDGFIGSCSLAHCGVVPLSFEEALARKVWFNRLAGRMGWTNPVPRDAAADELAENGQIALPVEWRDMFESGQDAV
jgi:hypothetical protein